MRILVTGGAGFLGSTLARRLLQEDNEIWCLDNFYTGRPENIADLLADQRFHLIHQDIIDPVDVPVGALSEKSGSHSQDVFSWSL